MSDPRNVAHAKKVTQEKKHQGAAKKKDDPAESLDDAGGETAAPGENSTVAKPPAALEGSLVVLGKLKELEFHSRANLESLAELAMTVEDELKQKEIVGPLSDVYSAQSAFQTKLTSLLELYTAECERMEGKST